jgi:hypothetical protein
MEKGPTGKQNPKLWKGNGLIRFENDMFNVVAGHNKEGKSKMGSAEVSFIKFEARKY